MYKLEGENILHKSGNMPNFIHYGMLYIAQETDRTDTQIKFEIHKFNFETCKYEHSDEKTEFEIHEQVVPVVDGFATVNIPVPEPIPKQPLSDMEKTILETAVNVEYLALLKDSSL